jgi:hypothetical protein
MALMTLEQARTLFKFDPETGKFYFRARPLADFTATKHHTRQWNFKRWNTNYSGAETFKMKHSEGYLRGRVYGKFYLAHRVAWLLTYGTWPDDDIDHINGDRSDNRIANLRVATRSENMKNAKMRVNNTSGVVGVSWHKAARKWHAEIKSNGRKFSLGLFRDLEHAAIARRAAQICLDFHENHGRA